MSNQLDVENADTPEHDQKAGNEPAWDIEAARARYRRQMRGRPMRFLGLFTVVVILLSWAFAVAAAYGPDVDRLPGHDITVRRDACIGCHARASADIPAMSHPSAPSCGFCHLQGAPQGTSIR